ncbi:glutamate-gated chloride channel [Trichonephila clavata]|uniref:Glutamate-gated chloride channel n=1 Tax=Trichonephila clavata TaxID=2740835 RepID=A0A8X6F9I7_TRICU|nr:glutamate-gated chloride channel [Trichonephila clavata]
MWSWLHCLLAVVSLLMTSSMAQELFNSDEIPRFESETDKQILDIILDRKRYDYRVRPSNKTEVNVTVLILSLSSPDESSLVSELHFLNSYHQKFSLNNGKKKPLFPSPDLYTIPVSIKNRKTSSNDSYLIS